MYVYPWNAEDECCEEGIELSEGQVRNRFEGICTNCKAVFHGSDVECGDTCPNCEDNDVEWTHDILDSDDPYLPD